MANFLDKNPDRIENAYRVYEALETGNLEKLFEDEETLRWAVEVYENAREEKKE